MPEQDAVEQHPLERLVEPFVARQAVEPRRAPRAPALIRVERAARCEAMQHVELVSPRRACLQALESPPLRTLEQDRPVLVQIPGTELLAKVGGDPDAHAEDPWSGLGAVAPAREHRCQALLDDIRGGFAV